MISIITLCAVVALGAFSVNGQASDANSFTELGSETSSIVEEFENNVDSEIVIDKETIEIAENDIQEEVGLLNVTTDSDSTTLVNEATDEVLETAVMAAVAKKAGYTVSDQEYEKYKEDLMSSLKEAEKQKVHTKRRIFGGIVLAFLVICIVIVVCTH